MAARVLFNDESNGRMNGTARSPRPKAGQSAALLVMAILAGCGGSAATDDSERADSCSTVPRSTLDAIAEGLTVQGGGTLSSGQAVQIGEWWYVAAEIDGPGMEANGDVGVWAMPDKDSPGPIIMADGFAREFSQWGTQTGAENLGVWQSGRTAAECL